MSFPRYPSYKDSGVEWLGKVPEHWEVTALKRHFHIVGGSTPKSETESFWNGDILWATPSDLSKIDSLYLDETQRMITGDGLASCGTSLVPADSIILSTRAPIGSLAIAAVPMCTNQGCKSLVPAESANSKYFAHLLSISSTELNIRGKGTTFLELSGDELGAFKAPVPTFPEQTQIAAFLDRETAKIDALVAEQRRLMELLKEKRQAVISHAVTQGLNPHAPMKPSGIEWLGDVPVHWEVRKLCNLARLESGHTPSRQRADYWIEEDCVIPWFTLADVGFLRDDRNTFIESTTQKISQVGIENSSARLLPPETVLLSRTASVGFSGITKISLAVSQDFAAWICSARIHPRYLLSSLRAMKPEFHRLMMGSTHQTIYMPDIEAFRVPVPPIIEQLAIVDFIEGETFILDNLTAEAQRAIDLLQERRTALISAAVTGQIDVRAVTEKEAA